MVEDHFNERLRSGRMGEDCVLKACHQGILPCKDAVFTDPVTLKDFSVEHYEQIRHNKVNGDIKFTDITGRIGYMDVKNGTWVSEASLENFRLDNSWYFFNAFVIDRANMYYMIRADLKFRQYALTCPRIEVKGSVGRIIEFGPLPVEHFNSAPIGNIVDFEPKDYRMIVAEMYDYNRDNNIKYNKRVNG